MTEQNQLNIVIADQSRISMVGSTDNTRSNNNDPSIAQKQQKREKKWILDLLFGNTLKMFLKIVY
ncbi:hypothetical protein EJD97_024607 [Solanum chilense]|uniref:Uncharacterized protein n=1 Tax=Solanum chilense TaxID=4083 RepID=A0A6N2AQH7_SOLCI|nr:hypothetical protein EJD97_024607 [Solanum chilense]